MMIQKGAAIRILTVITIDRRREQIESALMEYHAVESFTNSSMIEVATITTIFPKIVHGQKNRVF